MIIETR